MNGMHKDLLKILPRAIPALVGIQLLLYGMIATLFSVEGDAVAYFTIAIFGYVLTEIFREPKKSP